MAQKKSVTRNRSSAKTGNRGNVSSTGSSFIDELEKAREVVVREIREGFDTISTRTTKAAHTAAEATVSVKDAIAESHPKELLLKLVDEVEEIAEGIIDGISTRFSHLRDAATKTVTTRKTTVKKATSKKKVVARKKAAPKKTTVKKVAPKKAAPRKKAVTKKKAALKKKVAPKKKVATKKKVAPKKKAVPKKAMPKKKVVTRKKVVKKK